MSIWNVPALLLSLFYTATCLASPAQLTYQGRILKSDNSPLEYNNVSFVFQMTDPSGQCVIYQEQVTGINMTNSGGIFDVPIGTGTVQYPLGPSSVLDAFNNSTSFTCGSCSVVSGNYVCVDSSSTYSASSGDGRKLRASFYDGSGWKTITPDAVIRSVPYAGYALSAQKLGTNVASDFLTKAGLPNCPAGSFLTSDGTGFTCAPVSGATGGTVTNVTSANSYISVTNGNSTPHITLNVGTVANTVAAGNDPRLVNAMQTGSAASGDLSGTYPGPTVVALQGVGVSSATPANGQYLKFNGTNWLPSSVAISDVTNLSSSLSSYLTQSAFNGYVSTASCSTNQTMYWNSVAGNFQCQAINVSLAGDVIGAIGASKVVALQNQPVDATAPTSNQVLQWNGSKWTPATPAAANLNGTIPAANMPAFSGDVTSSAGSTTLTLANAGTAGTYYKVTTDAKGRVTAGSTSLVAADIPNLDWSKITSGKPATLSGYGITDSVSNAGGTPSLQTGTDASKPASPSAGAVYFATDTKVIYQYNSGAWVAIASASGTGGTITALTSDVSASGSGSVAATVNSVGGSTATNIHNAELAANAATNANTASTIVKRDASGNFSAGMISANLTGTVTGSASLNVLKSGDSMSGNLTFNSGKGTVFTDSTTNTIGLQAPTTVTSYVLKLPAAQGTANQMLTNDGSGNLSWTSLSSLGVTSVSVTSPVTNSGTASAPNIGIQQATTSQPGYLSSADWNTFNGKQGTGLNSANIWVGNASNTAIPVTPGGDVAMTNAGAFTVTALRGKAISATAPSASGQVLRYDGTSTYVPAFLGLADIRATITPFGGVFAGAACTAGQSLYWQSSTDTMQCQSIAINDSQLTYTVSRAANTFLAAPNGSAGAANYRAIATADLPASGVTAGTYKSVTVDATGRVTAGTNPTTAAGYGITDAFVNGGNSFGGAATLGTNDNFSLAFKTNGSTRATLTAAGKLGIGTTNPQGNFVVSNAGTQGFEVWPGAWPASATGVVAYDRNASAYTGLQFDAASIVLAPGGVASNGLNVISSGNVGIGTTTPTYALSVYRGVAGTTSNVESGNNGSAVQNRYAGLTSGGVAQVWGTGMNISNSNAGYELYDYTAGASRIYVNTSGSVGIGTTAPGAPLDVENASTSTSSVTIMAQQNALPAGGSTYIKLGHDTATNNNSGDISFFYNASASNQNRIDFGFQGGPKYLTVRADGNVGIGTTTPQAQLQVAGDTRFGCRAGFWTAGDGRVCMEATLRTSNSIHGMGGAGPSAVAVCKTVGPGSRVCTYNDFMQACAARTLGGPNAPTSDPFGGSALGVFGDHSAISTAQGTSTDYNPSGVGAGQVDDVFLTWNAGSCGDNVDGPARHDAASSNFNYRCCY